MLSQEASAAIERMKTAKALRAVSTLDEMRRRQKESPMARLPEDAKKEIFDVKGVEVERISFPSSRPDSALLYIHGGGFRNGWASNGYHLGSEICRRTGQTLYALNYRLAPEFTYPTAMFDCVNTWKWMMRNGVDPKRSSFIGTSAGGTLVLSTSLWCRDHGIPLPMALFVSSPYMGEGFVPTKEEIDEDVILDYSPEKKNPYFSTADYDDPYAYPKFARFKAFPFVGVYSAKKEILYSHSVELKKLLERDGVEHSYNIDPELWHAHLNAPVPENDKYIKEISDRIIKSFD